MSIDLRVVLAQMQADRARLDAAIAAIAPLVNGTKPAKQRVPNDYHIGRTLAIRFYVRDHPGCTTADMWRAFGYTTQRERTYGCQMVYRLVKRGELVRDVAKRLHPATGGGVHA